MITSLRTNGLYPMTIKHLDSSKSYQIDFYSESIGALSVLMSYDVPVAFLLENDLYVDAHKYSKTTSRHITTWVNRYVASAQGDTTRNYMDHYDFIQFLRSRIALSMAGKTIQKPSIVLTRKNNKDEKVDLSFLSKM